MRVDVHHCTVLGEARLACCAGRKDAQLDRTQKGVFLTEGTWEIVQKMCNLGAAKLRGTGVSKKSHGATTHTVTAAKGRQDDWGRACS